MYKENTLSVSKYKMQNDNSSESTAFLTNTPSVMMTNTVRLF